MNILILIPALLIFLYIIYKIVKDDYVFIRRNISLEQTFDIALIVVLICLIFSRFSFVECFISGIVVLYLIGRYKKIPLGRLYDFFTLAFITALPIGYIGYAILFKNYLILYSVNAFLYFVFAFFAWRFVYPQLMSRELKEGSLNIIFLIFFCFVSFVNGIILYQSGKFVLITSGNILLILLFIFSLGLFFKQAKIGFTNKKRV